MFKKIVLLIAFSSFFSIHSQEWKQNNEQTKVTFKIKNFGIHVDGNFNVVKIKTNFNSKQLSESFINAEINVKSISTGIEARDKHILKNDYFNEKTHKKIQFKSLKIVKNEDRTFSLFGNITIKGITKKIKVPIEILETEMSLMLKSDFTINRKDFNINGGRFVLSKTVKISVNFKGIK